MMALRKSGVVAIPDDATASGISIGFDEQRGDGEDLTALLTTIQARRWSSPWRVSHAVGTLSAKPWRK